jgi:hypothetical protein
VRKRLVSPVEMGKVREIQQAWSRQYVLDFGAPEAIAQIAKKLNLAIRASGEIGVSSLACNGDVTAINPMQHRLT